MAKYKITKKYALNQDPIYKSRPDWSGGFNDRFEASRIAENEESAIYNADLGTLGLCDKRPGLTLIGDDVGVRTNGLASYYPTGGTPALYRAEGVNVRKWTGAGNWSDPLDTGFTTGLDTAFIQGGESGENEVLFVQNGTDTPHRINSSDSFQDLGSGGTAPPISLFNVFAFNRWWILKNGFLYYSDAYSTDYSSAFSSSNGFRFSGYGDDKGLFVIRDSDTNLASSIIVFLQKGIWSISPSATPAATDKPALIVSDHGAIERKCICQVGDDIFYLAPDGIRSLKRTVQDKLQVGTSYPISYKLKSELANIIWSQSSKFHMVYWKDKLFFFHVSGTGTDINRCWVYWPANDDGTGKGWSVITGWNVTATAKFLVSGEERLYGGSTDGNCYRLWSGYSDNGTAINLQVETREEDFGYPANHKSGGELELISKTAGNYNIDVYASIDGQGWISLGTLNLASGAPTLPVNLPFTLANTARVSGKFHLDSLGRFKRIKFKFVHDEATTDQISLLEYNVTSYAEQYEAE